MREAKNITAVGENSRHHRGADPGRSRRHHPATATLKGLREIADEYHAALIFDEIQCGMGRTGDMWRCDHEGVTPDIMTFRKAFGGGILPITGIICRPSLWTQQLIDNRGLGSPTFGGNPPLLRAAAIATIKYMLDNDIPAVCGKKRRDIPLWGSKGLKEKYPAFSMMSAAWAS